TQVPEAAKEGCKAAIHNVSTGNNIHCGTASEVHLGEYHSAASRADGKFLNIDQKQAVSAQYVPQDAAIVKLNESLNGTYLWYGGHAERKAANQVAQDANAKSEAAAGAEVRRVASKASDNYNQADADLVDASKSKEFKLSSLKDEELPAE